MIVSMAPGPLLLKGKLVSPELGAGCELGRAVVEIVSVTAVGVAPLTVTEPDGEKAQFAPVGSPPVQAKVTVLLNPPIAEALRL